MQPTAAGLASNAGWTPSADVQRLRSPSFAIRVTRRVAVASVIWIALHDVGLLAEEWRATARDGTIHAGSLRSAESILTFEGHAKVFAAEHLRRLDRKATEIEFPLRGTLRRFQLSGGDVLSGELIEVDRQRLRLRSRFGSLMSVPRDRCNTISQPSGLIDLEPAGPQDSELWKSAEPSHPLRFVEDAEWSRPVVAAPPFAMRAELPERNSIARMQFGWLDPGAASPGSRLWVALTFALAEGKTTDLAIPVPIGESLPVKVVPETGAGGRFNITPRPDRSGWRSIVLLFQAGRLMLLVDGEVAVVGALPDGWLRDVEIRTERILNRADDKRDGSPECRLTRPVLHCALDQDDALIGGSDSTKSDVVHLASGDELYGHVQAATSTGIEMVVAERLIALRWNDVRAVGFTRNAEPLTAVTGYLARIELVGPADYPAQPRDVLSGAIVAATADSVALAHPVLGRMAIPFRHISRIDLRGHGLTRCLDATTHHLGDEVRTDFRRPRPEGASCEGSFAVDDVPPAARGVIELEVSDVEPYGQDAPRGTPFLDQLKAGFLRTELSLNGTTLGDINSHLTFRASPRGRQRVRIPFDGNLLKAGKNVWRLRQRPARLGAGGFDDCEIGPIILELEFPPLTSPQ